jgi:hypothetical protein
MTNLTICFEMFSNDICNTTGAGNITMCPNCEDHCPLWHLEKSCGLSRFTYLVDNGGTVFFAVFMSFWGKVLKTAMQSKLLGITTVWWLQACGLPSWVTTLLKSQPFWATTWGNNLGRPL